MRTLGIIPSARSGARTCLLDGLAWAGTAWEGAAGAARRARGLGAGSPYPSGGGGPARRHDTDTGMVQSRFQGMGIG